MPPPVMEFPEDFPFSGSLFSDEKQLEEAADSPAELFLGSPLESVTAPPPGERKTAWKNASASEGAAGPAAVMGGAESWPALSEASRASARSASLGLLNGVSDRSTPISIDASSSSSSEPASLALNACAPPAGGGPSPPAVCPKTPSDVATTRTSENGFRRGGRQDNQRYPGRGGIINGGRVGTHQSNLSYHSVGYEYNWRPQMGWPLPSRPLPPSPAPFFPPPLAVSPHPVPMGYYGVPPSPTPPLPLMYYVPPPSPSTPPPSTMYYGPPPSPPPPSPMYYGPPAPPPLIYHESQFTRPPVVPNGAPSREQQRERLTKQINYYFSAENLCNDPHLRGLMDEEGWVPVSQIAPFNLVRVVTDDLQLILEAAKASHVVEVKEDKMRKRDNWKTWSTLADVPVDVRYPYRRGSGRPSGGAAVNQNGYSSPSTPC